MRPSCQTNVTHSITQSWTSCTVSVLSGMYNHIIFGNAPSVASSMVARVLVVCHLNSWDTSNGTVPYTQQSLMHE